MRCEHLPNDAPENAICEDCYNEENHWIYKTRPGYPVYIKAERRLKNGFKRICNEI